MYGPHAEAPAVVESKDVDKVAGRLSSAKSVCVLTGSGISSESGLPTFRGAGGLWRTYRVEELASPEGFARDARTVWTWYNERRAAHQKVEPNAGHAALAQIERSCSDFTLVTQNVDSLHVRAGSQNVLELHGNLRAARCTGCAARRSLDAPLPLDEIEHGCGGRFRPDIVWFGESLPGDVWERAARAASRAEVMLVVGTSGMVNPAASLASRLATRAWIAEINPEETVLSARASHCLRGSAAAVLPAVARVLLERNGKPA